MISIASDIDAPSLTRAKSITKNLVAQLYGNIEDSETLGQKKSLAKTILEWILGIILGAAVFVAAFFAIRQYKKQKNNKCTLGAIYVLN